MVAKFTRGIEHPWSFGTLQMAACCQRLGLVGELKATFRLYLKLNISGKKRKKTKVIFKNWGGDGECKRHTCALLACAEGAAQMHEWHQGHGRTVHSNCGDLISQMSHKGSSLGPWTLTTRSFFPRLPQRVFLCRMPCFFLSHWDAAIQGSSSVCAPLSDRRMFLPSSFSPALW